MIPLGGYVKMLDEREDEVPAAERHAAFNRQPVLKRIAIVLAGPAANLLMCVALMWGAYMIGLPDLAPVIGKTTGLAQEAGLRDGDRILQVGDQVTENWSEASMPLGLAAIDREPITLRVRDAAGNEQSRQLPLDRLPKDFDQTNMLVAMGLIPLVTQDRAIVGLVADGAAARGILQPGDELITLNDRPISGFSAIGPMLQKASPQGQPVRLVYRRGQTVSQAVIAPRLGNSQGKAVWQLGIGAQFDLVVQHYGPIPALAKAIAQTGKQTRETFGFLGRLITGRASTRNLSGAIGIAQAAHAEADSGLAPLIFFMASLSLTLCIINLLPIPVLDGGHLLYYLIELVSGRPVSESVMITGQFAGLAVLAGLIILANFNDLLRIF